MDKKYYPVSGGEVPSITDRPGYTLEELKKQENTLMGIVNIKRMKEKIIEYLNSNNISYTQVIISPSLDLLISGEDIKKYPVEYEDYTFNWGYHLDMVPDYVSLDLSCVVYINGEDEEFIEPEIIEELGIDLSPIIVKYNLFQKLLYKQGLKSNYLPQTFGEYKSKFISEEAKDGLGYNLITDIVIAEKQKVK